VEDDCVADLVAQDRLLVVILSCHLDDQLNLLFGCDDPHGDHPFPLFRELVPLRTVTLRLRLSVGFALFSLAHLKVRPTPRLCQQLSTHASDLPCLSG
jgi:hypothetical protein